MQKISSTSKRPLSLHKVFFHTHKLVLLACTSLFLVSCAKEQQPADVIMSRPMTPYHIVARGETLSLISEKYGMEREVLVRINRLKHPYRIFIGQRLIVMPRDENTSMAITPVMNVADTGDVKVVRLPSDQPLGNGGEGGSYDAPASAQSLGSHVETSGTYTPPVASEIPPATVVTTPAIQAPVDTNPSVPAFKWPVQGEVIKSFGVDTKGQRNDGINIAAPAGAHVQSIDGGVVAHVGSQARGFGNLVLIKHPGGKISVYGHLKDTSVRVGDKVSSGQKIGTVGTSGGVSQPQLHFELRQGKKPLNPTKYLQ